MGGTHPTGINRERPGDRHTTFGRSGHLAPQTSFTFAACLRGQSAVISSVQSKQLGIDAIAFDQPVKMVETAPTALVALNVEDVELANDVAENDSTFSRHHNQPSRRKARSICVVVASISDRAAFNVNSAAKSNAATPDAAISEARLNAQHLLALPTQHQGRRSVRSRA
jgi:hypothetical protein